MRHRPLPPPPLPVRPSRGVLLGLILLPILTGGLLIWALWNPVGNLDRVTAAVVNNDVPVTVNGQTLPVGREFASALITGGAGTTTPPPPATGAPTTTPTPAASTPTPTTAATPTAAPAPASTAVPAASNFTWILTNDVEAQAGLASGRYAAVVTIPSSFSASVTSISGPPEDAQPAVLTIDASPTSGYIDPALTQAVTQAATAALNRELIDEYLQNIYLGFTTIHDQIGEAADGAASLSDGASSVSEGAASVADGAAQLSTGLTSLDSGASSLASGLADLDGQVQSLPGQSTQLANGAAGLAGAADSAAESLDSATANLAAVVEQVCQSPGIVCTRATDALQAVQSADSGVNEFGQGADQIAAGNASLARAMVPLVNGIDESAVGAEELATAAAEADSGAASLASGSADLATGAGQVDSGADQLAQSLATAAPDIPSYTDDESTALAEVAAEPVRTDSGQSEASQAAVGLFSVVALWAGGLAIALARQPVPSRRLMTSVSTLSITWQTLRTGALIGTAQGVVVGLIAQAGLGLPPVQWVSFAVLCTVTGGVFAIINQGLAAAFGAVGRLVAVLIGVVALSAGLSATVPPVIGTMASAFPTSPALRLVQAAAIGDAGAFWPGVLALILFAVLGVVLMAAAVATKRVVRARDFAVETGRHRTDR